MVKDPVEDFHMRASELRSKGQAFVVATVIEVHGSSSALTGSKALFDSAGKNLLGWVGGGCAERFIGEQAVEALSQGQTRIITADLDDEIFGLGVACGGKMNLFLEPVLPREQVRVPATDRFEKSMRSLAYFYGWELQTDKKFPAVHSMTDVLLWMSEAIAQKRMLSNRSLREVKDLPMTFQPLSGEISKHVTILGRSRITEALARHFILLDYDIRAVGPAVNLEDYPAKVKCHCLDGGYSDIEFRESEIVIVATHTVQDPHIVEKALAAQAGYVGMIGSRKRALEVLTHLNWMEKKNIEAPLFVPAGQDIGARNPDEIALSVVAEVLKLQKENGWI
jgi:xanthine/CO dehydrogenase XdhC/CoxF family maturation factor